MEENYLKQLALQSLSKAGLTFGYDLGRLTGCAGIHNAQRVGEAPKRIGEWCQTIYERLRSICTRQQRECGPPQESGDACDQGHSRGSICQCAQHGFLPQARRGGDDILQQILRLRLQSECVCQAILGGRPGARIQGIHLRQAEERGEAIQVQL